MFSKSAEYYDAVYSFKDYAEEAGRLQAIIERHKRSPGNRLLDVGCGTGAHFPYLKGRYEIEGVDLDPNVLAVARRAHPDVPVREGDMVTVDLGRQFDVVTCLFSSIGYVKTLARMRRAIARLAAHVAPGGLLIVEPWFTPRTFEHGRLGAIFVDRPDLKIARMGVSVVEGTLSMFDFHYLVGTPAGVRHFVEHHELGLFTHEEHMAALAATGFAITYDPVGLMGRGLYVGAKPS